MEQVQKIEEAKKIIQCLNDLFKENEIYIPMIFLEKDIIFIPKTTD